jgi:putative ABC transport system substrate-binding protein
VRRRDFIKVVAGAAAAWPLGARAQQPEQMRRIGILMNRAANDAQGQARLTLFRQALLKLGWSEDRNIQIQVCWGEDKVDLERKCAAELIGVAPDVILASGTKA